MFKHYIFLAKISQLNSFEEVVSVQAACRLLAESNIGMWRLQLPLLCQVASSGSSSCGAATAGGPLGDSSSYSLPLALLRT